jgi:hypothetical protein
LAKVANSDSLGLGLSGSSIGTSRMRKGSACSADVWAGESFSVGAIFFLSLRVDSPRTPLSLFRKPLSSFAKSASFSLLRVEAGLSAVPIVPLLSFVRDGQIGFLQFSSGSCRPN